MAKKPTFEKGEEFGDWTLVEAIDEGGNSHVWRSVHKDGRFGAIKIANQSMIDQRTKLQRFKDEIEILTRYADNPGVLNLLDHHFPPKPHKLNRPWIVTELGTSFKHYCNERVRTLEEIITFIQKIAATLAQLHDEQIYHRDIKEHNLFMVNGNPVIGDFGLVDFPGKTAVTGPLDRMGPLFHVAPEMRTAAADAPAGPADVYSLAKTLWVIATGQEYPLPGHQRSDTAGLTISAYINHPRVRMLDYLLERCTETLPNCRPRMVEVANELNHWLNPPSRVSSSLDLSNLSAEAQGIMKAAEQLQNQKELQNHQREQAIQLVHPTVLAIQTQLEHLKMGSRIQSPTPATLQVIAMRGPSMSDRLFATVSTGAPYNLILQSGFCIENTKDGKIQLAAAHVLQLGFNLKPLTGGKLGYPVQVLYHAKRTCHPCSSELENAASSMCQTLLSTLYDAARALLRAAEGGPTE